MLPYVTNYYLYTKQDTLVTGYPKRLCPAEPFINIQNIQNKYFPAEISKVNYQKRLIRSLLTTNNQFLSFEH